MRSEFGKAKLVRMQKRRCEVWRGAVDGCAPEPIHIMYGRKLLRMDQETTQRLNTSQHSHRMRTAHVPTSTTSTEISLHPRPLVEPSDGLHSTKA